MFTHRRLPLDYDGTVVSPGDVAAQAQRVMANLAVALAAAGAELTDVAKTTVYVASNRADLLNAWQVVRDAFGDHDFRAEHAAGSGNPRLSGPARRGRGGGGHQRWAGGREDEHAAIGGLTRVKLSTIADNPEPARADGRDPSLNPRRWAAATNESRSGAQRVTARWRSERGCSSLMAQWLRT